MYKRKFSWSKKAWYGKETDNDIVFGIYADEGGTTGEMSMVWNNIGVQLRCFHDAWDTLLSFSDVLQKMAELEKRNPTQEEFVGILLGCGFEDDTDYIGQYETKETEIRAELQQLEKRIAKIRKQLDTPKGE